MKDKKFLITGVLNTESIAYHIAKKLLSNGAEIVLTAPEFHKERAEEAVKELPADKTPEVLTMDATNKEEIENVKKKLEEKWEKVDGFVHSIAYADPKSCMGEGYFWAEETKIKKSFETSSNSLLYMSRELSPLFPKNGGSIIALTFDTEKISPNYGWMNTSKELLESIIKQVAANLGKKNIRVNGISAGPIETASGKAIEGFEKMSKGIAKAAPLPWDMENKSKKAVASTANFLLSDESKLMTGNIIYVDGGGHLLMPTFEDK